jgi:drug/metabolite transporter (DMT)-like permease
MPTSALLLALAAAFVHALWNILLARARDIEAATAVALVTAEVVFAPVAVFTWDAERSVWPFLVATGVLQLAYFALLGTAYRLVPLSVVYPIARGGAPVLVLLIGAVFLGHSASLTQVAAVLLVVAGILLVRGFGGADPRGIAFGVAIATCIAGYTLVDKSGVRHAEPITYLELSMIAPAIVYTAAVIRVKGAGAVRAAVGPASILAGICTFGAYALVLAALQRAPAASVAAVRETSVVIAALLAAVVLRERVPPSRLAGAVVVAAGIAMLAL